MTPKETLILRLTTIEHALSLGNLLDKGITESEHNEVANVLRKGLGIIAFNTLEDFIKKRTMDMLSEISSSTIEFNLLTDSFKDAATHGALKALLNKVKDEKRDKNDWIGLIQTESLCIHSTASVGYKLSQYSFLGENSNISNNDVTDVLKAVGISGGWNKLKEISSMIYGGIPDLGQAYKGIATRRHLSAHEAQSKYTYDDIKKAPDEIRAIAASFDIALKLKCRMIIKNPSMKMDEHNIDDLLAFRFITSHSKYFTERKNVSSVGIKNYPTLDVAISTAKTRAEKYGEILIVLDNKSRVKDWYC